MKLWEESPAVYLIANGLPTLQREETFVSRLTAHNNVETKAVTLTHA